MKLHAVEQSRYNTVRLYLQQGPDWCRQLMLKVLAIIADLAPIQAGAHHVTVEKIEGDTVALLKEQQFPVLDSGLRKSDLLTCCMLRRFRRFGCEATTLSHLKGMPEVQLPRCVSISLMLVAWRQKGAEVVESLAQAVRQHLPRPAPMWLKCDRQAQPSADVACG